MLLPDYSEEDLAAVLKGLGPHLASDMPADRFIPIEPAPGRICAVDGGSAILFDGGSFTIAAVRAGSVLYDGTRSVSEDVSSIGVRLFGSSEIDGDGGFMEPISSWRAGMEEGASIDAIVSLGAGDVLAIDGALIGAGAGSRTERILTAAAERRVHVVGVSKKTRLVHEGRPAVMNAMLSADACGVSRPWHVPLMTRSGVTTSIAMLHPVSTFAFRIDHTDPGALGVLAAASGDPVYPGYPYPLARAHNAVAIHTPTSRGLRSVLADRCRALDGLGEFHEVLDRNW